MTENSPPDVGRAAIDAYLDSVEQALLAAHAPRSDRLQVLQDLESQIADMLAREPAPLTEESVRSVIEKLEPPRHFADTYGHATESTPPSSTGRFARLPHIRWSVNWPTVAALSCTMLIFGCLLAMLAAGASSADPILGVSMFLIVLGFVLTPIALWKAFRQLQAQSSTRQDLGRELVLKSTAVYCTLAPALPILLAIVVTEGVILFPIGIAAIIYAQYMLIRRLWRHMAESLPKQPDAASTSEINVGNASTPIGSATPMPAM
jgi:hypothetical protein